MNLKSIPYLLIAAGLLLPIRGSAVADTAHCVSVSAGAETTTNGLTVQNVGQTVIGRASGGGRSLHAGVLACLVAHPSPVSVTEWRSIRTHGGGGPSLAIALNATATGNGVNGPTPEPRNGGVRQFQLAMNGVVSSLSGVFSVENLTDGGFINATSATLSGGGTLVEINFAGGALPDGKCYRLNVAGNIAGLTGDSNVLVRALIGDTNRDGQVSLIDFQQTKAQVGNPVNAASARFDVNVDNALSLIDVQLIKSRIGRSVSCP